MAAEMERRMNIVRGVAAGAIALVMGVLVATPAEADTGDVGVQASYYSDGGAWQSQYDSGGWDVVAALRIVGSSPGDRSAGEAIFGAYGEWFDVYDHVTDGLVPIGYVKAEGGSWHSYRPGSHNLSFAEGLDVSIKVCFEGTSICSSVYVGRA
jgi:hypothetical protein